MNVSVTVRTNVKQVIEHLYEDLEKGYSPEVAKELAFNRLRVWTDERKAQGDNTPGPGPDVLPPSVVTN